MLENDNLQASINNLNGYMPAAKKHISKIFKEEAIRQLACFSNVFDGKRQHARLVISRCSSDDIVLMRYYLETYIQFFAEFDSINEMCAYCHKVYKERVARCISEDSMVQSGSTEAIRRLSFDITVAR